MILLRVDSWDSILQLSSILSHVSLPMDFSSLSQTIIMGLVTSKEHFQSFW